MSAVAIPVIPVIRASDPESVGLAEEALRLLRGRSLRGTLRIEATEDPETGNEEATLLFRPFDLDPFGDDATRFRETASAFRRDLSLVQRMRIGFGVDAH